MNLVRALQGLKDIDCFATETKQLYIEGQLTEENIKAREEWIKLLIEQGCDAVIHLTETAQMLSERTRRNASIVRL